MLLWTRLALKLGDEVIVQPLTVISNAAVIFAQNAVPVFADIDPDTFNIDPVVIERKITEKTKAIMPVSLYSLCCELDPILKIAEKYNLSVITMPQKHIWPHI